MITYISGGTRSGKSSFAQDLALQLSKEPVYVATARIWDEEFSSRVKRHKEERGPEWVNYEKLRNLYELDLEGKVAVIDCVTLWLSNIFMDCESQVSVSLDSFRQEIDKLLTLNAHLIIISNEIGMGLHADTPLGRQFTDLQGWANQYVASKADVAIFMVSGLPVYLKNISS